MVTEVILEVQIEVFVSNIQIILDIEKGPEKSGAFFDYIKVELKTTI